MFVGHFAVGFGAKAVAPRVNLGYLVTAAALVDLLWTIFLLLGLEHARVVPGITAVSPFDLYDYPWSHSLALDLFWALAAGGMFWAWKRDRRGAAVIAAAVLSHYLLDWVSHAPDMLLWPGGQLKTGLGLWRSMAGTVVVEGSLWVVGLALYLRYTRPVDRIGRWSFWLYVAVMTALYGSSLFGPPPADMRPVAFVNLLTVLFLIWPAWFDRHRAARVAVSAPG
jgi:membrane-bound metal-dependent hydrolase YbcI (DUF457 family)